MLRQMHLIVSEERAPFEPESGAYAQGGHGAHGDAHVHASAPVSTKPAAHVHGPGCGHDHGH